MSRRSLDLWTTTGALSFSWRLKEFLVIGKSPDILPLNISRFGALVADE